MLNPFCAHLQKKQRGIPTSSCCRLFIKAYIESMACSLFLNYQSLLLSLRESRHAFQKKGILKNKFQRVCFLKNMAITRQKKNSQPLQGTQIFWKLNKMGLYLSALLLKLSTSICSVFTKIILEGIEKSDSSYTLLTKPTGNTSTVKMESFIGNNWDNKLILGRSEYMPKQQSLQNLNS